MLTTAVEVLDGCIELRQILRALPRSPLAPLFSSPLSLLLWLNIVWSLPPLTASIFGIWSSGVSGAMASLAPVSSPIAAAFLMGVATCSMLVVIGINHARKFWRYLGNPADAMNDPGRGKLSRGYVIDFPKFTLAAVTLFWLFPNVIFFVSLRNVLHVLNDYELGRALLFHGLLGLIATGYSILLAQPLILRNLYPRFWLGSSEIRTIAGEELGRLRSPLKLSYGLVVLPPLTAAALAFHFPTLLKPTDYALFPICIALALAGIVASFVTMQKVAEINFGFTAGKRSARPRSKG